MCDTKATDLYHDGITPCRATTLKSSLPNEMGIRMALGASAATVRLQVIRETLRLTMLGVVLGAVAALGLTRLLASLLFGVTQTDPLTYAAMAALLAGTAVVAGYLPARRASRVAPALALRAE